MISVDDNLEKVTPKSLLKVFSDESAKCILKSASEYHKSAYDLSKDCQVSLTTIYRQIKKLNDMKLLTISGSINKSGRKNFLYKSKETVYCRCACSHMNLSDLLKNNNKLA